MKQILIVPVLLACSLFLLACSAPALQQKSSGYTGPSLVVPPAAPTSAPAALPPRAAQPYSGTGQSDGLNANIPNAASAERMIVYNASLGIEVQDADKAASDITTIVSQNKGYVAATNMSRSSGGQMSGTITLRIPAENLDAAQKQIEAVGLRVLNRNKSSNDVTDQYTDLNARLTNLQAAEVELRELLTTTREKTGKADDILAVYNQLTQVRGQIEQIKGQMNVLSQTSAMATLTVSLIPREQVQIVEPEGWLPDSIAREALHALVNALQGLATLGIWGFLFMLPLAVVIVLPFLLLVLILRAILRRTRKRTVATA